MKLQRLFEVKENILYKIDGGKFDVTPDCIKKISWSDVEGEVEEYNEDFLAKLRDELKEKENEGKFVFIEGDMDKQGETEVYIQAMKHTARRIKDCVSVIGFAIPDSIALSTSDKDHFIDELSAKHAQYCYFSKVDCGKDIVKY